MKNKEWKFLDKTNWGAGAWTGEPDKAQWTDARTLLPCLAVRNQLGAWCGYVGVSEGHPLFGVEYDFCPIFCLEEYCQHRPESFLEVHYGVNFSRACAGDPEAHTVCHLPEPGEPDKVFWFGFDCSHLGDIVPGLNHFRHVPDSEFETYKTLDFIKSECASLAKQLHVIGEKEFAK